MFIKKNFLLCESFHFLLCGEVLGGGEEEVVLEELIEEVSAVEE